MVIHSKIKDYEVFFKKKLLEKRAELEKKHSIHSAFFFVDYNVFNLYRRELNNFIKKNRYYIIKATEDNKEFSSLSHCYKFLIENSFTRRDVLFTIGGGILQDISGFVSSTLYRGIKWIFIPTTLLAQADSCIGSKTSINFEGKKNLIGNFYPPDYIYIDTSFCETLTPEYFNSGLGEILKFHLMSDEKRYQKLKNFLSLKKLVQSDTFSDIILSTLEIKKSYFEGDEFDTGRRNLLNYGHCFGHALESASSYSISHGEAVIVGMGFANLLSRNRGIMSEEKYNEFEEILNKHYPIFNFNRITAEQIIYYLKHDKKREGKDLTMILSEDIGKQYKYTDIKEDEIINTYDQFVMRSNGDRTRGKRY